MADAEPIKRTSEIEEATNLHVIHPISSWLVPRFARLHVHPNAVSVAGMVSGAAAGIAYYHYHDRRYAILGFVLMILWHVMDGADGQLARLTRLQSPTGKVLDGICDYVTFVSVYAGLALALRHDHGAWIWAVIVIAGVCHAVQAAAYEVQRQDYNFWGWGRQSAELLDLETRPLDRSQAPLRTRIAERLHRIYARVQVLAIGANGASRSRLATMIETQPERAASIRALYRSSFAPVVRQWSVMSANYRTIGIFLFAFLQIPLGYFLLEIFGLSAILAILVSRQPARYAAFFDRLSDGRAGTG
ncbi:CDP-alcohol phosphatidyltransferase family protein [Lichenicola sp.]|uniref:CDP-alcohol phosphatidyltransferase family protein n=1 Tax=Lichenicola sp. TaxID=2804529 RepID=UPI003B001E52